MAKQLQAELEKAAKGMGAAYFGVADLSLARNGPVTPYEKKYIADFPFAISVGFVLSNYAVDAIADHNDRVAVQVYRNHAFDNVNILINMTVLKMAEMARLAGVNYMPVTAALTVDEKNRYSFFSQKMAANLAGLGWIGKSCLMITPDRGPRVRWGSLLIDAPLTPGKPLEGKGCGACNLCVETCPGHAFSGKPFKATEPREVRMDVYKCYHYTWEERPKTLGIVGCGLCVQVCPFGRKKH